MVQCCYKLLYANVSLAKSVQLLSWCNFYNEVIHLYKLKIVCKKPLANGSVEQEVAFTRRLPSLSFFFSLFLRLSMDATSDFRLM